jgi:hypothetical protein
LPCFGFRDPLVTLAPLFAPLFPTFPVRAHLVFLIIKIILHRLLRGTFTLKVQVKVTNCFVQQYITEEVLFIQCFAPADGEVAQLIYPCWLVSFLIASYFTVKIATKHGKVKNLLTRKSSGGYQGKKKEGGGKKNLSPRNRKACHKHGKVQVHEWMWPVGENEGGPEEERLYPRTRPRTSAIGGGVAVPRHLIRSIHPTRPRKMYPRRLTCCHGAQAGAGQGIAYSNEVHIPTGVTDFWGGTWPWQRAGCQRDAPIINRASVTRGSRSYHGKARQREAQHRTTVRYVSSCIIYFATNSQSPLFTSSERIAHRR